ncbi:hypothetical protein MBLNU230_g6308t1 [Neophaeotheca triangularis]
MAHPSTSTRHPNTQTAASSASHGSQTITQTPTNPFSDLPSGTLRLRGHQEDAPPSTSSGRRIQWAEDVVDNEGMGKKSSKVCCIYHKPREPGDSESESDTSGSSSGDDSDSEPDLSRAQRAGGRRGGRGNGHGHDHERDGEGENHPSGDAAGKGKGNGKEKARQASPNAYERQPRNRSKKKG